jgi:phosphatidate cytidylyltransferase
MTRVLSAIALLAILIAIVFLPPNATLLVAVLAAAMAFAEYVDLAALLGARVPIVLGGAAVTAACVAVGSGDLPLEFVLLGAMIGLGTFALLNRQPGSAVLQDTAASLLPVMYIGMPLGSFAAIRLTAGREAILLLMATIVVSDSAQYYTGRVLGRRALAPTISPNKTMEGAVGGLVLGTVAMTLGGLLVFRGVSPGLLALASAIVVVAGMLGDLFESLLKRSAGVKDSSDLIPGHGGVLDRIDSWLFAGPVYYAFTRYLQGP